MQYKAILFDMDGVLISSGRATKNAFIRVIEKRTGVTAKQEDFIPFVGAGEGEALKGVCQKYGVKYEADMKDEVYEIYRGELFSQIETFEKIPEALSLLKNYGFKIIIASSADMIKVETNLERAGISPCLYDDVVCGSMVERRKPFPDIYIKAAELSRFPKEQCLAVEDAVSGIKAAVAAGIDCMGITSVFDKEMLLEAGCVRTYDGVYDMAEDLCLRIPFTV